MRSLRWLFISTPLFLFVACGAREPKSPESQRPNTILPLRSLRLYETGVGYFERSGAIAGEEATALPVPAGHLDDALKSLVVLDGAGSGKVSSVSFSSSVTKATARSRAGLPADPDTPIAFRHLLASMKGERVAVHLKADAGKEPVVGRVIEVTEEEVREPRREKDGRDAKDADAKAPKEAVKRLVISLLSERGDVAPIVADDIGRIRPLDAAFAARLDAALDSLSTRSAQNARALRLHGDARGKVTFGYIAEAPIWRASYRLVWSSGAAELQGWALLHNDTDENWRDVHLELVNGEPDSFLFPLAAPRYARRELLHPDEQLSTAPQLQATTADALWGDHLDATFGESSGGYGFGSGHGRLGGAHSTKAPSIRMGATSVSRPGTSSLLAVGNLADLAAQNGVEQGALFVYAVPSGFSLEAHASALVPFLQKSVTVENIAFFGSLTAPARAAIRFVNNTGQTLPAGTIAVFGAGGFSGETSLDRLKPGERRFLQIGNDLDAEITEKKKTHKEESKRLTFDEDRLHEHYLATTESTWELENRSGSPRTFYVAISANQNATVNGADRVDFDQATSRPVVVFTLKPKQKETRTLTIVEGLSRPTTVNELTEKNVRAILAKSAIPAAELATLQQGIDKVRALENGLQKVSAAESEAANAQAELERLREDLKALGANSASAAPLVKRVVDAEARVEAARKNKETTEKTLDEKREGVRTALRKLSPKKE